MPPSWNALRAATEVPPKGVTVETQRDCMIRAADCQRYRRYELVSDPMVSFFVRHRQFLLVRVDHEHGQQLSGFGLARVLTNAVPVTRHLGEALPAAIRNDRPIIDRTSDGSLENGRIDESRLWMRVGRRRAPGSIFHQYTLDAFARHIRQSVFIDERDLCILVSGHR